MSRALTISVQEVIYQSLQTNTRSDTTKASGSSDISPGHVHSGDERRIAEKEGESSQVHDFDSQLDSDEAFARSLQELESRLADTFVGETTEAGIHGFLSALRYALRCIAYSSSCYLGNFMSANCGYHG